MDVEEEVEPTKGKISHSSTEADVRLLSFSLTPNSMLFIVTEVKNSRMNQEYGYGSTLRSHLVKSFLCTGGKM